MVGRINTRLVNFALFSQLSRESATQRLAEQGKQEVVRFLEGDRPLPHKYRFLLLNDKCQVELVWNGKTNEVASVVLPFQTIEQIHEPRSEGGRRKGDGGESEQGLLFDVDARGRQLKGSTNKLNWGTTS